MDVYSPLVLLTFLLPTGTILLSVAAFPEQRAVSAAMGAVVAWALAALAYFVVGFAFQFGGVAVVSRSPDLAGLYWEYSLLDVSWGDGWGMIGLKGFLMMSGEASTPGALTLFLAQLPLLGMATLIPYFALWERTRQWVVLPLSLLVGGLIYPLTGNWIWGGGWLANLGLNLSHGHGLIDAAGGGQAALVGAAAAVAALLVFRSGSRAGVGSREHISPYSLLPTPRAASQPAMPTAHLPVLGWLGAMLMAVGWMAMSTMVHLPGVVGVSAPAMTVNMLLAAFGGALAASLYAWFTTGTLDVLMSGRGIAAGLVVTAASAPFIPAWAALAAGLLVGLLLPLLIYVCDQRPRAGDMAAVVVTFGFPAVLGLLLPGLLADGRYGAGWNRVGADSFLGVAGQGVSGAWVAPGLNPDWPGQLLAQLIGIAAIVLWSFSLSWLLLSILRGITHVRERSRPAFEATPAAARQADAVQPAVTSDAPYDRAAQSPLNPLAGGPD